MGSYFRDFYAPKATQQPTIGDTKFSVIRQDHMGWLNCDGRVVPTETYPLLFRVIGYSFDPSLSNDLFRLPDMRSAIPGAIGPGSNFNFSSNVSTYTLGNAVGEETHTLIINEMPAHTHGSNVATGNNNGNGFTTLNGQHDHGGQTSGLIGGSNIVNGTENVNNNLPQNAVVNAGEGTHNHTISPDGNHTHQIFNTGGSQPHNNMQPTVFIGNMFIYSGKIHGTTSKWRYELDTNIL
jgi:microcystin-dependent protein